MKQVITLGGDMSEYGGKPMTVTLLPKKLLIRRRVNTESIVHETLGSEVDRLVQEWYAARGLEVPEDEKRLAASIDAANVVVIPEEEAPVQTQKPEFGTPEFWAWARAQRAEKNKALAAQGLPPLPTAKEKAAAKAARASAKLAKLAKP
jgi:hypothetical protein